MNYQRGYLPARLLVGGIALPMIVAISGGCGSECQVEQHHVPKQHILDARHGIERERPPAGLPPSHPPVTQPPAASAPQTMFAAMVPHGESTWFFKIQGAREFVEPREPDFRSLVESIHFDADSQAPQWNTPEGWRQEAGSGLRLATLFYGTGVQQVELSVISLVHGEGDYQAYVLDNVNRWRGQVRLPPVESAELLSTTERVALPGGAEATLAVLHSTSSATATQNQAAAESEITYELPDGWISQEVSRGGERKAAFSVGQEDRSVEITLTALPARAGALLPNVNRWRGQLRLDPITAEELASSIQPLEVGSTTASYLQLIGENQEGNPETIFAVIFIDSDHAWFLKLWGDPELAGQEKMNFEAFARSLQVDGSEE